jgi:hypothetical protein
MLLDNCFKSRAKAWRALALACAHAPVVGMPLYTCHVPLSAWNASDAEVGVPLCAVFIAHGMCRTNMCMGFISTCV